MRAISKYSLDEMREIAREYSSQWSTDESSADVDKYDFTFEKYDLTNLKVDLRKFLESEYKLWLEQFGEEEADERLMYFMEEYPFDEHSQKNDPIIVVEKDGKGYVWDGTHRVSGLLDNNIYDAWAIVGRPKEDLSEGAGQRGGSKLNLKQALEIRDNQYRSRDAQRDYQPEEIDNRILELLANKDERDLKLFEKQMEEWPDDVPWPAAAKLVLRDYTEYSTMVAKAYEEAPKVDPRVVGSYKALAHHNEKMFEKLLTRINIEFRDEDSYKSFKQLKREVENTGLLKVFKGGDSHPLWTDEQNWKFRAVHDLLGHLAGTGHSFSLRGELAAYNQHLKIVPKAAIPALFCEVVGQVCTYYVNKEFPEQKAAYLDGFNFERIGEVDDIQLAEASVTKYNDLFEAAQKAADSFGFDDKDMAFWQCNLFSQAVARIARYLGYDVKPIIVDAKWQTNSGDVELGQVYNHVLLRWGDKYVDFTIKQIDDSEDFPLVVSKLPKYFMRPKDLAIEQNHGDEVYVVAILDHLGILSDDIMEEVGIAMTTASTDWPPEWLGYGITEKDLAFLYAVADNFTGFLTEDMMEDYHGLVYRKSEFDGENHDSFWTADQSVADKFDGKLRVLEYSGKAWLVSKYLEENHLRLARIKHELGGDSKMWELEELVATGLAYNSTEKESLIVPDRHINRENITIIEG
jgi:hypothetical protein